jgi:hypothetical protein
MTGFDSEVKLRRGGGRGVWHGVIMSMIDHTRWIWALLPKQMGQRSGCGPAQLRVLPAQSQHRPQGSHAALVSACHMLSHTRRIWAPTGRCQNRWHGSGVDLRSSGCFHHTTTTSYGRIWALLQNRYGDATRSRMRRRPLHSGFTSRRQRCSWG